MMAKPTAIVVWFDDGTYYHIDPRAVKSFFMNEAAARACGHAAPHRLPGLASPVRGPFTDKAGPPGADGETATTTMAMSGTADASADAGSCYYVNGMIVCP